MNTKNLQSLHTHITLSFQNNLNEADATISCEVNEVKMRMLIDSGSDLNTITDKHYEKMKHSTLLRDTNKSASSYTQDKLCILGKILATIELNVTRPTFVEEFFVVRNAKIGILGRDLSTKLGILKIGFEVNSISETIREFPKAPGVLVKFQIDKKVTPKRTAYYRVPYALEAMVEKKLDTMEKRGIIEEVKEYSEWISPLVVVPKGEGGSDVRIVIDMRNPNTAIKPCQYPLPVFEEFTARLAGAEWFSKLDLTEAFHHLPLDEESSKLTTFMTSKGLRRYTRLTMGVICATGEFQRFMDVKLAGIKGARAFVDDILIHGKDKLEHDQNLEKTLQVIRENGMEVNQKKCEIGVQELEFLGHTISNKGITAAASKVEAIKSFRRPESIAELQSFLGLVNYVSKFISDCSTQTATLRGMLKEKKIEWTPENSNHSRQSRLGS